MVMGYDSSYSTPETTPLWPEIVGASTPWCDIQLEDYQLAGINDRQTYWTLIWSTIRAPLRKWNRPFWLAVILTVGIWWSLRGGHYTQSLPDNAEMLKAQVNVDGLQFIDATHPHIRVCIL